MTKPEPPRAQTSHSVYVTIKERMWKGRRLVRWTVSTSCTPDFTVTTVELMYYWRFKRRMEALTGLRFARMRQADWCGELNRALTHFREASEDCQPAIMFKEGT